MKVYRINDCDWYMARSLYDAVCAAIEDTGLPFDEVCDDGLGEESASEMRRLKYVDDDENRRTFAEQLDIETARDPKKARLFASTEM